MVWKSKGFSDENIKPPTITGNSPIPEHDYVINSKFRVEFNESCLKPDMAAVPTNKIINFYITLLTMFLH